MNKHLTSEKDEFLEFVREMNKREMINFQKNNEGVRCGLCGKRFSDDEFVYLSVKAGTVICSECSVSCILCTRGEIELMAFKPTRETNETIKTFLPGILSSNKGGY